MTDFADNDKTYELLREKIKSKMDVTKFFAGFISIVFGIMLKDSIASLHPDTSSLLWLIAGMSLIVFSLGSTVAALFAYDRLLMPPRFLEGSNRIEAINDAVKLHMVKAWSALFVPAVASFFGALLAFASSSVEMSLRLPLWIGFGAAALLAFILYIKFKAPFEIPD